MKKRVAIGIVIGGGVAIWVLGFMVYAGHDRLELIDLPEVRDRADAACASMAGVPGSTNGFAVPDPETILAENESVSSMAASVKSLGAKVLNDDRPTNEWLKDWGTLVNLRIGYSEELRLNPSAAKPQIPEIDGVPISRRMERVALECRIPDWFLDDFAGHEE